MASEQKLQGMQKSRNIKKTIKTNPEMTQN